MLQPLVRVSEEDYFRMLAESPKKLEYHDGEVIGPFDIDTGGITAMAGAKLPHNLIVSNLIRLLGNCLIDGDCLVLNSDQLVHLPNCKRYVFPDIIIICQKPQLTDRNGIDVLENPEIIIEVLSDSTELFDRGEKFDCYKQISSVSEYVLVSSKKRKVEVFRRTDANEWLLHDYRTDDEPVTIGACTFPLSEIYRKVVTTKFQK